MSEIETRAAQVADVSFPKRLIDLIVMPYETEAQVVHRGRVIGEIVSRGAFGNIQQRAGRVKVNRDHDVRQVIGRAVTFHPSREEGLVAQVKITGGDHRPFQLGDETLLLADDGLLDASAGFTIKDEPNAEVWETRSKRRLNAIWLVHIALTPEAAYESANVLAVRQAEPKPLPVSATPNLDRLMVDKWRRELDMIDARYGL
jgi:HK97 family phage prohead protease